MLLIKFLVWSQLVIFMSGLILARIFKIRNKMAFSLTITKYIVIIETVAMLVIATINFTVNLYSITSLVLLIESYLVDSAHEHAVHFGRKLHRERQLNQQ